MNRRTPNTHSETEGRQMFQAQERTAVTEEMLEQLRQEAFMEGYRYAIELLQESIVSKEKA